MESKEALSNLQYDQPFPTRLRELLDRKRGEQRELAARLGKTSQAIGYYKDGSTVPDANVLAKIADFYHVSTDYLLGRTDVATPDITTQAAARRYGLSENALNIIEGLGETDKDLLNEIITSPRLSEILSSMEQCKASYTLPKREKLLHQMDRTDDAVRKLSSIISQIDNPDEARPMWQLVHEGKRKMQIIEGLGEERADAALSSLQRAVSKLGEDLVSESKIKAEAMTEDSVKEYIWTDILSDSQKEAQNNGDDHKA